MNTRLLLLLFVFGSSVFGQKFELGKVSVKELEERRHPTDTSATAAVLFNKAKTALLFNGISFDSYHEFEIRIKIYKKEGLALANYEVNYFIGYENINPDILQSFEGTTFNLVNGIIKKDRVKSGEYKETINQNRITAFLLLPNVNVGSVIEFKYKIKSESISTLPSFKFQREIPVNYAEYRTELPVYLVYKPVVKGFIKIKTESKIEEGGNKERVAYQQATTTHIATQIPALIDEIFTDNIDNYLCSIDYELEVIKRPNKPIKYLAKKWSDVAESVFLNPNFGGQLKVKNYFEGDLKVILNGLETREEKINAIFNFLKVKVKWNEAYGIFTYQGVKNAYESRTGNVAEINIILCAMLNASGILASPVLISTIKNGIATFPNQTAFNYVIAATEINGQRILLDATNKFTQPNVLPLNTLNWTGTLVNLGGSYEIIDLTPQLISKKSVNCIASIDNKGKISGKVRMQKSDYEAFSFREKYTGINRDAYLEKLENILGKLQIDNYNLENESNLSNPIIETFDFVTDNSVEIIGDKMYITPLLFLAQTKNPFVQEERKLPIYFGYPRQNKFVLNIEIPEGYTIESLPSAINIATGEDVGVFKYVVQATANKIQIIANSETNKMLVSQDFYSVLKEFYQKIVDKQNEKIVLKKT